MTPPFEVSATALMAAPSPVLCGLPLPWVAWLPPAALSPAALAVIDPWLDAAEQARVARFHQDADRQAYRAAHGLLRWLVGAALGCGPGAWRRVYTDGGAPRVDGQPLHVSLSHTRSLVAAAVAVAPIGVDVEDARRAVDWRGIAERYFHPRDRALLQQAPDAQAAQQAFFALWTLKEAYLKAMGTGLRGGLDQVWFTLTPGPMGHFAADDQPIPWQCAVHQPIDHHPLAVVTRPAQRFAADLVDSTRDL